VTGPTIGWLVVVLASMGLVVSIYGFFRNSRFRSVLVFCLVVLFSLLLVPAPVPGYPGDLAPAFLVALFESLFQADGKPLVAFRLLGIGLIVGVVLASAMAWIANRWIGRRSEPPAERRLPPRRSAPTRNVLPRQTSK
jgi:hypothetical protein